MSSIFGMARFLASQSPLLIARKKTTKLDSGNNSEANIWTEERFREEHPNEMENEICFAVIGKREKSNEATWFSSSVRAKVHARVCAEVGRPNAFCVIHWSKTTHQILDPYVVVVTCEPDGRQDPRITFRGKYPKEPLLSLSAAGNGVCFVLKFP